jgi:transcription elongation factor Elf1
MKCKVCGKEFELLKENKKIVASWEFLLRTENFYEAFDCPYCGCQNIVNKYNKDFLGGET